MTTHASKLAIAKQKIISSQFVFELDHQTLLPIDLAAPVAGKSVSTFRTDVTRRPDSLPRLTRINGRVFVRVSDLLNFINQHAATPVVKRRPGRPTKAEQAAARCPHTIDILEGGAA